MGKEEVAFLVQNLKNQSLELSSVVGPVDTIKIFGKMWSNQAHLGMHQGIYELKKIIHPDY